MRPDSADATSASQDRVEAPSASQDRVEAPTVKEALCKSPRHEEEREGLPEGPAPDRGPLLPERGRVGSGPGWVRVDRCDSSGQGSSSISSQGSSSISMESPCSCEGPRRVGADQGRQLHHGLAFERTWTR